MSTTGVSAPGPATAIRPGKPVAWWGMIGMMVTEGMLFGLLFFAYFFYRAQPGPWPPAGLPLPELHSSGIRSLVLIGSSLPMVLGERALKEHGQHAKAVVWMVIALAMAGVFLIGHVQEQFLLIEELSPTEHAYGSLFLTVLNFHALHLIAGMVILAFVITQTMRGAITRSASTQLEVGGLYWHYVDAIWVAVYSVLYLSPHLLG